MPESGRRCRPSQRRAPREVEELTVKPAGDDVQVELRGRLVRTLVGSAADEVRRALADGDAEAVQRVVARLSGRVAGSRGR